MPTGVRIAVDYTWRMAFTLAAFWAWNICDKAITSYYSKRYKPVPLPENPSYSPRDVSIIVPTIDTESTFTECMRLWLKSEPREIIIVTVARNKDRVVQLVEPFQDDANKIIILTAPRANKRQQLVIGVAAARAGILALVDDDVFWRNECVVPYLLAPFEDPTIGAVAGIQSAEIPPERRDPQVITAWEAIAAYDMHQWKGSREVHFTADGGCWCLSARTLLIRTAILRNLEFTKAYTQELIGHRVVNTADDVILTEWVFDQGWNVSIQNLAEAEVTTNIHRDYRFAWQVLRWDRGNFRSFLGFIFVYPGLQKLMRRHPYTTFKMVERLARPVWAFIALSVWLQTLRTVPWIARHVWAFLVMDYVGPVVDLYIYLTMSNDNWLTRAADIQVIKK
ncbi:hypothetical protein JX265_012690 [Neoarthrinium moseri]|uniref:Polysaccharide synthase n=1 Tax=Neoarthrinium moseri TaxID=1658444 RepID=A0A9Q0AJD3_9PEZI|nr:hypothetical protein JX266_011252 [Neoarthrinium moseri]KAI1853859.1 hypothetical protein JX265_012690 [Neoarthrinium moseri]